MAVVLVPFPFAGNGYTLENLIAGDEREFGGCTEGLVAEGFIALETVEAVPPIEEPASAEDPVADLPVSDLLSETPRRGRKRN